MFIVLSWSETNYSIDITNALDITFVFVQICLLRSITSWIVKWKSKNDCQPGSFVWPLSFNFWQFVENFSLIIRGGGLVKKPRQNSKQV